MIVFDQLVERHASNLKCFVYGPICSCVIVDYSIYLFYICNASVSSKVGRQPISVNDKYQKVIIDFMVTEHYLLKINMLFGCIRL